MKVILLFCLAIMSVFVTQTQACELHGGFGGPMFSRFGQETHFSSTSDYSKDLKNNSTLKLNMPSLLSAKKGSKTDFKIKYENTLVEVDEKKPPQSTGPAIKIIFDSSPNISITTEKITIDGKSGEYTFTAIPERIGTHRLVLTAKYANKPNLPQRHEVIYMKVSE